MPLQDCGVQYPLAEACYMPSLQAAQLSAAHTAATSSRSSGETQVIRPARQASLQQIQVWRPSRVKVRCPLSLATGLPACWSRVSDCCRSRTDIERSYLRQWQEVTARGAEGQASPLEDPLADHIQSP
jgi:hypothetical protein